MAQSEIGAAVLSHRSQRVQIKLVRQNVRLADGRRVAIRPIRPADAEGVQAFFAALSPRSRRRRFHFGVNALPQTVLRSLTEVDQHHHVALIALADSDAGEGERAVVAEARYVLLSDCCDVEFAIAVADDWQGNGLGGILLRLLGDHARLMGNGRLVGDVLVDNLPMRALVGRLGGRITTHPESERLRRAIFDTTELSGRASSSSQGPDVLVFTLGQPD